MPHSVIKLAWPLELTTLTCVTTPDSGQLHSLQSTPNNRGCAAAWVKHEEEGEGEFAWRCVPLEAPSSCSSAHETSHSVAIFLGSTAAPKGMELVSPCAHCVATHIFEMLVPAEAEYFPHHKRPPGWECPGLASKDNPGKHKHYCRKQAGP